jgi:simple sugar transport system permease protein
MTAGRGYMAFSAVIFGAANPIGVAAAALFFSAVEVTGVKAQLTLAGAIPQNLILALPYIATVFGLWLSGRTGRRTRVSLAELRDY